MEINLSDQVTVTCRKCDVAYTLKVQPIDMVAWQIGTKHVQEAFPYLSIGDRELLISRTCDTCWTAIFGDDDE